jgi:tRNA threonylcarbamoyladenosine biosynthesis protein TsaE
LEIVARIQSPTFALVNEYTGGRLPLAHLDLYRLETAEQIIGAGLEDYFRRPAGVVVVEWCERWPEFQTGTATFRARCRRVRIETLSESSRLIVYEDSGR